jgi:hypothetical protein
MTTATTGPTMIDPGEFAHTEAGLERSADLAAHVFGHLIEMTEIARLDTTITSVFLLVEVLAALEVYADLTPEAAIKHVHAMTRERVASLRRAELADPDDATAPAGECECECPNHGHPGSLH